MNDKIAVKVEHVSKNFVLPHLRPSSVKSILTGFYKQNVTSENETQHALNDISFEIKKGEFFGIVGRNGSGKSTLLKILAGIYQPTKGKVTTCGKLVPFIELGVGFNPELTGRENIYLNGAMLGFSEAEVRELYDEIVAFAELERFMDQKLKNYSSGMQVRLAFSMAVRANADILLIDEVLAVGDADFQRKCFEYFRSLKKNKKTVVFVSHDMSAVREYCDRAVLIENSKLILEGSPSKISKAYTRMFNDVVDIGSVSEGKRWGTKKIEYTSTSLSSSILKENTKNVSVTLAGRCHEDINDVVFGFSVKLSDGKTIMGTNTQIETGKATSLKAGQSFEVVWVLPDIFNNGKHYIDPAIVYNGGSEVADWWEEALTFEVRKDSATPYPVRPNVELSFNKDI